MSRLEGKVALGNRGVQGHRGGIAKGLAAAGASVAVNYASDRSSAEAVVAAITASGGRAIVVPGYVSKSADVARLFVETKAVIWPPAAGARSLLPRRNQYKGDSNEHIKQRLDREEKPNAKAVHDHRTALV